MGIDDPLLPAAVHLTGPDAGDLLRPAVAHAGGSLGSYRCAQVHYRPGHDVIARFRADVEWGGGAVRRETILVATTRTGAPEGSVPVEAETPDGHLTVGVWRWPFDPALPALEPFVRSAAGQLEAAGLVAHGTVVDVEVVTYRPTERAVLRLQTPTTTWYLKAVRPSGAPSVVRRHHLLSDHGLPVPRVVAEDTDAGWVLLSELAGPTLRTLIKTDAHRWLVPGSFRDLIAQLSSVDGEVSRSFRSRLSDSQHHVGLLSTVMPTARDRLDRLAEFLALEVDRAADRPSGFVHGDLHEGQLIVDDGRIAGVLDIDEAGIGDPIDDIGVPAAHLRHRALTAPNGTRIDAFVDELVAEFRTDHDPRDIAAGTVAVLTGLATAPFRRQADGWRARVGTVLDLAERTLPPP